MHVKIIVWCKHTAQLSDKADFDYLPRRETGICLYKD